MVSVVACVVVLVLLDSGFTVALWDDASTPVALVEADETYPFSVLLDNSGLSVVLLDRLWPSVVRLDETWLSVLVLLYKPESSVVPAVEVQLGSVELLSESPSADKKSFNDREV